MARKRKREEDQAELSPEEKLRRQKQRELRELAIQVRSQGKDYQPRKSKHKVFRDVNSEITPRPSQARKQEPLAKDTATFQVRQCNLQHVRMQHATNDVARK